MTKFKIALVTLAFVLNAGAARADLEPYKDYTVSDAVWSVTTIKVNANMDDAYLEGIKKTWIASSQVQKDLGHIEDFKVFRSDMPASGDFNLMLVIKYKNDESLAPNKARYEAFMAKWGAERQKETQDIAQKNYPGMRTITGEYQMREVTLK
jgi:hypothetical protein